MKHSSLIKLVLSALFAALIFIGTQFIKVPLAFGYFNFGDIFILIAGYFIGGAYAVSAAAIGSVSADLLSGYAIYAPATLLIKSFMSLVVFLLCRRPQSKSRTKRRLGFAIGTIIAEIIMVTGYYLFDSILYGFSGALASLPGNLLQGISAVVIGNIIMILLEKAKIFKRL